jgi:hypothetical protein
VDCNHLAQCNEPSGRVFVGAFLDCGTIELIFDLSPPSPLTTLISISRILPFALILIPTYTLPFRSLNISGCFFLTTKELDNKYGRAALIHKVLLLVYSGTNRDSEKSKSFSFLGRIFLLSLKRNV